MNIKSSFDDKYLVVDMGESPNIINHQIGMLLNNKIKYFLETKQQIKNNKTYFFYDTNNKISLEKVLEKRMRFNTFLNFAITLTKAMNEAWDYQLSTCGIIFDRKYIFLKEDGTEPEFIYIPFSNENISMNEVRQFLKSIIMDNFIDIGNDDFKELISILNGNEKTPDEIRIRLESISKKDVVNKNIQNTTRNNKEIKNDIYKYDKKTVDNIDKIQDKKNSIINKENNIKENKITKKQMEIPNISSKAKKNLEDKKEEIETKKIKNNNSNSKKRLVIISITGILVIIFAFMFNNGFFNNKNGELDITMPIMFFIVILGIDFLIYRRMSESQISNVEKKKVSKENIEKKKKKKSIFSKNKNPEKINVYNNLNEIKENDDLSQETDIISDDFYDKTELMEDYDFINPYFENIIGEKIYIKGKLRFGKTPGAYGYIINNSKVSRIHADVFIEDNRLYITDLQSKNGTYINDSIDRICCNEKIELFDGDKVRLANEEFIVHI